jgi:uncharacterized protein (TIGR02246 family)
MSEDEQQIREVIRAWIEATAAGDVPRVLELMADDVVFLMPGQQPMRGREAFAKGFHEGLKSWQIDTKSNIREIKTFGDWAYAWNHLTVTVKAKDGSGARAQRSGEVLSIFQKEANGRWVLARDANMLALKESSPK